MSDTSVDEIMARLYKAIEETAIWIKENEPKEFTYFGSVTNTSISIDDDGNPIQWVRFTPRKSIQHITIDLKDIIKGN